MLDTVREFGWAKHREEQHEGWVAARHRDWYAGMAARPDELGPRQIGWLDTLHTDHSNIRAALDFCRCTPREQEVGLQMVCVLIQQLQAVEALARVDIAPACRASRDMIINHRRALLLSAALLVLAAILAVLVAIPATRHNLQSVDDTVRRLAVSAQNRPTTLVAEGFSLAGGVWVNWPIRIAAIIVFAKRRQFVQHTAFVLAVVTSEILIGTLKAAYDRPRPPSSLISTSGSSFPSGHAIASAVTAVGLVVALLPPGRARWRWEVRAVIFSFLMAFSRVYLRAHWLSDVVAGGLLGAGLALGWPALLQAVRGRPDPAEPAEVEPAMDSP
jgi:undecaprenyl-diphosphatase